MGKQLYFVQRIQDCPIIIIPKVYNTHSPMRSVGRGAHGCKAGVEIPSQRRPPTSPKVAQLIVSSEFTVIRPVAYASIR